MNRGITIFFAIAVLFFTAMENHAQQAPSGHATDFTSVEYFTAPNQMRMKSRLSGAEAQPMEGGLLDIKQLRLELFATNGQPQVIVNAPECVYDSANGLANSSGKLLLQNGDRKIHIEGEGFLWRQTDSSLTISNNVKTVIASMVLAVATGLDAAPTNSIVPTNSTPRVTNIDSDRADFDMNARTAIYRGDVRVSDSDMKLTCVQLVANLPQSGRMNHVVAETNVVIDFTNEKGEATHATGDKAVYNYSVENGATNETVTLTGNPQVENVQGNTTADTIIWDRMNNSFRFINFHGTIQNLKATGVETNSPVNTNELSAPK